MIEEIKNSDFTDVLNSKLAVVDFSAVWCGPCQMLAPIMEELSDEMDGEVDFFSADVDENRDLAYQFVFKAFLLLWFLQTEKRLQEQ